MLSSVVSVDGFGCPEQKTAEKRLDQKQFLGARPRTDHAHTMMPWTLIGAIKLKSGGRTRALSAEWPHMSRMMRVLHHPRTLLAPADL